MVRLLTQSTCPSIRPSVHLPVRLYVMTTEGSLSEIVLRTHILLVTLGILVGLWNQRTTKFLGEKILNPLEPK